MWDEKVVCEKGYSEWRQRGGGGGVNAQGFVFNEFINCLHLTPPPQFQKPLASHINLIFFSIQFLQISFPNNLHDLTSLLIKLSNTIDFKVISEISVEKIYMYTHISSYILLIKKCMKLTVCCILRSNQNCLHELLCQSNNRDRRYHLTSDFWSMLSRERTPKLYNLRFQSRTQKSIYPEYGVRE